MKRDEQGVVLLSPLRFHFDANELRLPVRLGLLNAGGKQDLIVYVIHPTRASRSRTTRTSFIPTNLEVADDVRKNFAAFYAELFDATVEQHGPQGRRHRVRLADHAAIPARRRRCRRRSRDAGLDVLEGSAWRRRRRRPARQASVAARERARATPRPFYGSFAVVGADAPARPLRQGDAVRGSVFREAKPAMGGRANWNGTNGDEGATSARRRRRRQQLPGPLHHPPLLERAGRLRAARATTSGAGRPATRSATPAPTAAKGLATAPRGKIVLKTEVRSPVPLLGIAGKAPPRARARRSEAIGASDQSAKSGTSAVRRSCRQLGSGNRGGRCALVAAAPGRAHAFCGFFVAGSNAKLTNNASQVVLMRKGNRTVMTMSNNYQGPPENFAMVVPVPVVLHKEDVKTLPADVFDRVDSLSAPRLVEYWEQDPCRPRVDYEEKAMARRVGGADAAKGKARGRARTWASRSRRSSPSASTRSSSCRRPTRRASRPGCGARSTTSRRARPAALAPYIRDKSKFFVAKVDIKKVKRDAQGVVQLSPLRFSFDANELRLPVRLGLLNAGGKQDLIVYVIHPTARFEVANYANIFIPTNLEVADGVRNNFAAFFAELFDATVEKMGRKVVVTEYAWQTTGVRSRARRRRCRRPISRRWASTCSRGSASRCRRGPAAPAPSRRQTRPPVLRRRRRRGC